MSPYVFIIYYCYISTISALNITQKRHVSNYNNPTTLPEIIINRSNGLYNYPIPNPPPVLDEPLPKPPPLYDHYGPPSVTQDDPLSTYLPPNVDYNPQQFDPNPDTQYPPSPSYGLPNNNVQIRVLNMSCLDTTSRKFFRVNFCTQTGYENSPIVENSKKDCVTGGGNNYYLDVNGVNMVQCGIRYCSSGDRNLCAQIRIPTVRGIRLPEDPLVTFQCRPQGVVATKTKHFRITPQFINSQGRSLNTVASGGSQRNFDTQVSLYKRAPGSHEFNQLVTSGGTVALGEELLLRASVRDGDGWKYSRMGDVLMRRISQQQQQQQGRSSQDPAVTLVDGLGCRVPAMKSVCPEQPRQVDHLTTTLTFRAFMFQGSNSGDEMMLSVRMLGCLQQEDCIQLLNTSSTLTTTVSYSI